MKYIFKKYLHLPTLSFSKNTEAYLSLTEIGQLYQLSYTNQRAYFYTNKDLAEEGDIGSIFSVEGIESITKNFFGKWYQRRLQDDRLKKIARYLVDWNDKIGFFHGEKGQTEYIKWLGKKVFFPNNIIVSLNNELWNPANVHSLCLDDLKTSDAHELKDFRSYLEACNVDIDSNGCIDLTGNKVELCRINRDGSELLLPVFELSEETTDQEIIDFAEDSPIYSDRITNNEIPEVKLAEKYYKLAWIIDGQHRTFSLRFLNDAIEEAYMELKKEGDKGNLQVNLNELFNREEIEHSVLQTKIAITAYIKSDISEQANVFIDVNNNAKAVDKSLTFDLLPLTDKSNSVELACKKIFDEFNENEDSPLYNYLFNIRGQSNKGLHSQNILSQANFINELRVFFKKTKTSTGLFHHFYETKKLTPAYWLLYSFFDKIGKAYQLEIVDDAWRYKDKEFWLFRTTWFWALLQFFEAFLFQLKSSWITFEDYNKPVFESSNSLIDLRIRHYVERIHDNFDFRRSLVSDFRGKAGQKELADLLKIVSGLEVADSNWSSEYKAKLSKKIFDLGLFLSALKKELHVAQEYATTKPGSVDDYVTTLENLIREYESNWDPWTVLRKFKEQKENSIDVLSNV